MSIDRICDIMRRYQMKILLEGLVMLVVLSVICYFIWDHFEKQEKKFDFTIRTNLAKECSKEVKLYYTDHEGRNYYLDCLDSVILESEEGDRSLRLALEEDEKVFDLIMKQMRRDSSYWDGGSVLYKEYGKSGFTNHGLAILQCNTISGNRDYYIGPVSMKYETGFCTEPH